MYAVLIYGFPLILIMFEYGFRSLLELNTSGFTGPSLAVTGLSFLVPLLKPQRIETSIELGNKVVAFNKHDSNYFVPFAWIVLFLFIFLWLYTCQCSIATPQKSILGYPEHLVIGGAIYGASLVLIGIKRSINNG